MIKKYIGHAYFELGDETTATGPEYATEAVDAGVARVRIAEMWADEGFPITYGTRGPDDAQRVYVEEVVEETKWLTMTPM